MGRKLRKQVNRVMRERNAFIRSAMFDQRHRHLKLNRQQLMEIARTLITKDSVKL